MKYEDDPLMDHSFELPLFPSDRHPGHNVLSRTITRTIHHLCDIQGIDGLVDARCYRSMTAAYVYNERKY